MSTFLEQLNKVYFWDIDLLKINENESRRLIIERILNYGNLKEI
jgi:hypothetical protein